VDTLKSLTVRISDEQHQALKILMAENKTTIQEYILKFIESSLLKAKEENK
jgi:dsDNA-binding SOS-regulon protein